MQTEKKVGFSRPFKDPVSSPVHDLPPSYLSSPAPFTEDHQSILIETLGFSPPTFTSLQKINYMVLQQTLLLN